MSHTVAVRHNFETAHRLPHLGGKCTNLHGHSWWATITIAGPLTDDGTVVEFGTFKHAVRTWVDTNLDHATMLGTLDPLLGPLRGAGCRVYEFGGCEHTMDLPWPTVENVATLLGRAATRVCAGLWDRASVVRVDVDETHVNRATWWSGAGH